MAKSKERNELTSISRNRAVKIFEALGFQTANKWDSVRLQKKIGKLTTLIEGADLDVKTLKHVNAILRAQEKGKVTVDSENPVADKQAEKEVKAAAKREAARKVEKKEQSKKEAKKTKKTVQDATRKVAKKKTAKKVEKKDKKPGLMMSMYEFIQIHQPVSAKKILSLLKKRFPERDPGSIERCIPRYPKCLADSKGITDIALDAKDRYYIKK